MGRRRCGVYPSTCEKQVQEVAEALHVDAETAYMYLAMGSVMTDLSVTSERLVSLVIADNSRVD